MKHIAIMTLILLAFAPPAGAVMFTITDGTYTPASDPAQSITGTVELSSDIYGSFVGNFIDFFIDGFDAFPATALAESTHNAYPTTGSTPLWDMAGSGFYDDNGLHIALDAMVYFSEWEQVSSNMIHVLDYDCLQITAWLYDIEHGYLGNLCILADAAAAPVPEPATLILLGTGLLGWVGTSRKKSTRFSKKLKV